MSVLEDLLECQWGQQVLSDYHVVKCIHIGPLSEVFSLESDDGRQRLILKAMSPAIASKQVLETLKTLAIEGIVPILDYHVTTRYAYVIKPYLEGISLQDYMTHGLSVDAVLGIIKQLVQISIDCHSQSPPIILRDIKPDNLIIHQGRLYLLDMESCKLKTSPSAKRDTVLLGTPGYAAPEQYGFQTSDERTDIYAIGQVMLSLLHLSTGTKVNVRKRTSPLGTGNLLSWPLQTTARRIAERATAFDPQRRFQSAQAFKIALESIYPKLYMSFLTMFVVIIGMVMVGFGQVPIQTEAPVTTAESTTQTLTAETALPAVDTTAPVTTTTTSIAQAIGPLTAPLTAQATAQAAVPPVAQPLAHSSIQATQANTEKTTAIATEKTPETAAVVSEVRFSGTVGYTGEVPDGQLLIKMAGITDPSYENQFGSKVSFKHGLASYTDINKRAMVTGHDYQLTAYLDLDGNFKLDSGDPKQVIPKYYFDGTQPQIVDFLSLTSQETATKAKEAENTWMPGVYHLHQPEFKTFKTSAYRSQMPQELNDFDAFTVYGTNTSPSRATEYVSNMVANGQLNGLQYARSSTDYHIFASNADYVANHMVIFMKNDALLGYVYIVDGKALPYVIYKP